MSELADRLAVEVERTSFSGVVRVRGAATIELCAGDADRANRRPNRRSTRFATASGTKGLTALTTMALVEAGQLDLDTTVRSVLGDELANIDERVTVEQLLGHRSGIGDYLDENELDDIDAHILDRSAHEFVTPSTFLPLLAAPTTKAPPGEVFAYNNSGYMILSVIIERLTGSFVDTVTERVLGPADMTDSGFFRSDELPHDTALGYLENGRTNVFHLPVVGGGDGGAYVTVDDLDRLWAALFDGRLVAPSMLDVMTTVRSTHDDTTAYGLGFWLSPDADHVWLEGMDAGVSMQTGFRRSTGECYAVLANTSSGAWPLARAISHGW